MKRTKRLFLFPAVILLTLVLQPASAPSQGGGSQAGMRRMGRAALEDKIRGGWAGKMIGVSYGAPTEFRSNAKINEAKLAWSPERVSNSLEQDDLYVGMTMSETMDRLGLDATTEQYGEAFKVSKYDLWHANAAARRILLQGGKAPMSGHPKYNIHANDIDFQIEADFIGMMTPGLPRESNKYSERVGRVMNFGDGLYGGVFLNGMYTAAFFETDPRKVVEQGLATIPAKSQYALLIRDVLDWSAQNPNDWRKTWQMIEDKWDKDDPCPEGALKPFNIDAKINGAYIVLGLFYGGRDFGKTVEIATRAGQDSDCNPSSAAGVLGVMIGYAAIPDAWKSGIPGIADKKFAFTNLSYKEICHSTLTRALKVVQLAGGKVSDTEITVPYQTAKPAKLEQWDMGIPDKIIKVTDDAWDWKGGWTKEMAGKDKKEFAGMAAAAAGAEAILTFTGTAVAVEASYEQAGWRGAEVYLDGTKFDPIVPYFEERTHDTDLWHTYGLKPGRHTLRIVTKDDPDPSYKGRKIIITEAIAYRSR